VTKHSNGLSGTESTELAHGEAFVEWTNAGGLDPMKARDEAVIAASEKVRAAEHAVIDHRKAPRLSI